MQNTPVRIAINGFGRIGRTSFKIAFDNPNIEIVAINDLSHPRKLAHMLSYDSIYGHFKHDVYVEENGTKIDLPKWNEHKAYFGSQPNDESYIVVDGKKVRVFAQKDPAMLPWKDLQIDCVLECTGVFVKDGAAKVHLDAGAKCVVLSAPAKGEGNVPTFMMGVNSDQYLGQNLISNASCTTNSISPVVDVIHKKFGILKSALTTIHATTSTESIVDSAPRDEDLRKARAAFVNLIPTTSGAAIATTKAIPALAGKFDGVAVRVPVAIGSLSDITMLVSKPVTVEEINNALIEASEQPFYKDVLGVSHAPIVSTDVIGCTFSGLVDLAMTRVVDGDLVKIMSWYDNEWGYSSRLVELAVHACS
ncbi:MAG: type I glyceraldehyde-3-phosphate dehydrogenase [Patescibacteria group bacterium]